MTGCCSGRGTSFTDWSGHTWSLIYPCFPPPHGFYFKYLLCSIANTLGILLTLVDLEVLEQFIAQLPEEVAAWVQCHYLESLEESIMLAEVHLVVYSGRGQ